MSLLCVGAPSPRFVAGVITILTIIALRPAQAQTQTSSVAGPGAPRLEPPEPGAPKAEPAETPPAPVEAPPAPHQPPHGRDPSPAHPPHRRADPPRHDPQGSLPASGVLGLAGGSGGASLVIGAGIGYAVFSGVVPGLRGLVVLGSRTGGELAFTLSLTPPFGWSVVPFVVGEAGHRWLDGTQGWIVGVGGGAHIGRPEAVVGVRVGWIWRRYLIKGGPAVDASAPIIAVQFRF